VALTFRAREWWEYKSGPVLALLYGTALLSGVSLFDHWPAIAGIVVALAGVAASANILNDWTDIDEDLARGKPNQMSGRPTWLPPLLWALTTALGWLAAIWLQPGTIALAIYAVNGLIFVLYSVRPIRLKTKGGPGVVADAAGAHTLPALFALISFSTASGTTVDPVWLMLAMTWSFTSGLRGILWHQLADQDNDRLSDGTTFVCRIGPAAAQRLGERIVFPIEVVSLAGIIWWCGSPLPIVLLAIDVAVAWLRQRHDQTALVVVETRPSYQIALHEFSDTLLPLSLLAASMLNFPRDGVMLAVHLVVFPMRFQAWSRDLVRLAIESARAWKRRIL
jgi:4-hydroxybenzoate polyprenyltransferase